MAEDFKKPITMGVNLENGYFSEDGQSGFGVSAYAGRLSLKFWKKGEKSSDNRDNTISLNINQLMVLNNMLAYVIKSRQAVYETAGSEGYTDITNLTMVLDGVVNAQPTIFGVIRFDTVEIDGIKRIKFSVKRNSTENSVIFCDRFLKGTLPVDSPFRPKYDVLDSSFVRFCMDINGYSNFAWNQAAFNKLFSAIVKPNGGGNNGGGRSNYQSSGKPSAPRYEASESGPLFDDGEEF